MSSDFMSTFAKEDEAKDFSDVIDYRANYRHLVLDGPFELQHFPMLADIEVSMRLSRAMLIDASYGVYSRERIPETRTSFVQFEPTNYMTIRAGYFMPVFGIMTNDHSLFIKKNNRLGRGSESYNLELWGYKKNLFQSFYTVSSPAFRFTSTEENFYRLGTVQGNTHRVKIGYMGINRTEIGISAKAVREVDTYGMYIKTAPYNNKFYTFFELDYNRLFEQRLDYFRAGYFIWRGMDFFIETDGLTSEFTKERKTYLGLDWSIRPRFEISLKFAFSNQYADQYQFHSWF